MLPLRWNFCLVGAERRMWWGKIHNINNHFTRGWKNIFCWLSYGNKWNISLPSMVLQSLVAAHKGKPQTGHTDPKALCWRKGHDMRERGAVGRRRHLCLSHASAELLALPPSQEGHHSLAVDPAREPHGGGRKSHILWNTSLDETTKGLFPPLSLCPAMETQFTHRTLRDACAMSPLPQGHYNHLKSERDFFMSWKQKPFTKLFISMNISMHVLTPRFPHRTFP